MTIKELKNHIVFKQWIDGYVNYIFRLRKDENDDTFVVIHSKMGKFTITRIFKLKTGKLMVSVDYKNISTNEVFELLVTKYSERPTI